MLRAVLDRGARLQLDSVWVPRRETLLTSGADFREERLSARLNQDTPVKSPSEEACKRAILATGVVTYYELHKFPTGDGIHSYLPDFTMELTVCGKQVMIEPHGFYSGSGYAGKEGREAINKKRKAYLDKIRAFHETHESSVYLVMVSDIPGKFLNGVADEYWKLNILSNRDPQRYRCGEERLVRLLNGLIRRSDQAEHVLAFQTAQELAVLARAS